MFDCWCRIGIYIFSDFYRYLDFIQHRFKIGKLIVGCMLAMDGARDRKSGRGAFAARRFFSYFFDD